MSAPATPGPWALALGGMLALAAAMGIGRFVYTPILPMMAAAEDLTAGQAGMIASSNFLGYLAGATLAASALIRGSPRVWLLASLFASAATTLAMAWTRSYAEYIAVRFAGGIVSAWVLVFASALVIPRLREKGQARLGALHFAGVGIGISLAALVTALATATESGWRGAWVYNGFAAFLAAILVLWLVPTGVAPPSPAPAERDEGEGPIGPLLTAYGLFGFGYIITATFIVQLVRAAAYPPLAEMVVWLLVGLAAVPSVWLWNNCARRTGNSRAYALACVLLAIGVAASVLMPGLYGLVAGAVLLGGTFMGITALGLVEAGHRSGGDPRRSLGLMTAAFGIGQILGPLVGGTMRDVFGSFLLPSMLASLALLVAARLALPQARRR